ncbi:MAG TPA: ATP-binding cassette domain-containing protein [Longimicrobiales bacterium]|nr:ATP-binding cassette domain-containing protein [Longimicrobiales bacterium]
MIEYRGIYKAFDVPVLAGVDLEVRTGEMLAIVGRSGCGKTVLLKITIGLIVPDRGDVCIDGESIFFSPRRTVERIRRRVGYVFQNAALFDSMTVFENVAQGLPERELKATPRRRLAERVAESLERVDLDPLEVFGKLPSELSGGMRKRVGLARAIVGRPSLLLYDEPVTGLDPVTASRIHHLVRRVGTDLRATSVLVTHHVEGALRFSDRIALLDGGVIRFVGTPAEFRASDDPLVHAFAGGEDADESAAATEAR